MLKLKERKKESQGIFGSPNFMVLKNWRKFSQKIAKLVEFVLRKTKSPKEFPNFRSEKGQKFAPHPKKKHTLQNKEKIAAGTFYKY
jgi:hypothetical protein